MRGLSGAALLLVPALLRGAAAHREHGEPSALITIQLPSEGRRNPYLSFRVDVLESLQPCGAANVTINGQALPADGDLSVQTGPLSGVDGNDHDGVAVLDWHSTCLAWGAVDSEQRLDLRVRSVDGAELSPRDADQADNVTVRFRQTAPARVIDVEGAVSVFRFYELPVQPIENLAGAEAEAVEAAEAAELLAWQQSLSEMRQHAALVRHDIRTRERYIRYRFGASWGSSFLGTIIRKIGSFMGTEAYEQELIHTQYAWMAYSPFSRQQQPTCGSNSPNTNSTTARLLLPPPPQPPRTQEFLFRCPAPDADSAESFQAIDDADAAGNSTASDGQKAWQLITGQHSHQRIYGMLAYLIFIAVIAYLVTNSVHRCHDKINQRHRRVYDHDVEEGRAGIHNSNNNNSRRRPANIRSRVANWYQTFSADFHRRQARRWEQRRGWRRIVGWRQERRRERQERREERRQAQNEEAAVQVSLQTKMLRLLKRILFGRGDDGEKLPGTPARPNTQQPALASSFIETVVVRPPTPPEVYAQEEEDQYRQEQQREEERYLQRQRQQQRQLDEHTRQQLEELAHQQQMQLQVEQRLREQQFLARQLEEQRDQQRQLRDQQRLKRQAASLEAEAEAAAAAAADRTPSPTLEQEIASFRAAADVVDQIIAAEEGRMASVRTAEAHRQRDQQQIASSLTRAPEPRAVAGASSLVAAVAAPPPPPPPPPSSAAGSASPSAARNSLLRSGRTFGYGRRHDAGGIDSDFDDTESQPPAYSETGFTASDFTYDDLAEAEASMVADGFQYRPSRANY